MNGWLWPNSNEGVNNFVDLKSNSALLYNKGHNLKKCFDLKNSPKLNISLLKDFKQDRAQLALGRQKKIHHSYYCNQVTEM